MKTTSTLLALALVAGCATDDLAVESPAAADWNTTVSDPLPSPPQDLTLTTSGPAILGQSFDLTVTGLNPGERAILVRGDDVGEGPCPPALGGQCIDLTGDIDVVDRATADGTGTAVFTVDVPAGAIAGTEGVFRVGARRGLDGIDSVVSNNLRLRISDGDARVRVIHGSPDAPAVSIWAGGALLADGLAYGEVEPYFEVAPGAYTIDIRAAGADVSDPVVFSFALTADAATDYTAVATGFFGSTDPADQFRVLPLVDSFGPPAGDTIRVRVVHGSPEAGAVDIDVFSDGAIDLPGVPRFADSGAGGVELPADGFAVSVTEISLGATVPFTIPALPGGSEITLVAVGEVSSPLTTETGFGLLASFRDGSAAFLGQDPIIHVLHASPDAPAVDLLAGGATVIDGLPYRDLSAGLQLPPGMYDLDVFDDTQTVFVDTVSTPMLEAGNRYVAIATGFLTGTPGFQVLPIAETFDGSDVDATLQLVHASPNAGAVDIGVDDGTGFVSVVPGVDFTDSATIALAPGAYPFALSGAGAGTTLFGFDPLTLGAGDRFMVVASGDATADFGLEVIDLNAVELMNATVLPTTVP